MPYMLENDVFGEEKNWALVTPEQIRELRQHFLDTWNEEDGECVCRVQTPRCVREARLSSQ